MNFPKNAIITATHGSYYIPRDFVQRLSPEFRMHLLRLVRNFSDFETRKLLPASAPVHQKLSAWFSRILGDPNRDPKAADVFRETDFAGIPIWQQSLSAQEKSQLLERYHKVYHTKIMNMVTMAQAEQEHTILFDVHDTGNLMLQPDPNLDFQRENPFPKIVVGNCFGASCRAEIFALFVQNLKANFACDVVINKPYSGGHVTQTYGQQCNAIQIEFDRATLCESKQRIAANSLEQRQKLLEKTIIATAKEFES